MHPELPSVGRGNKSPPLGDGLHWLNLSVPDLHRLQQSENRVVPLGVTFKLGAHSDLDVFYMITSLRAQAHWQHESVIGTYLRVRF